MRFKEYIGEDLDVIVQKARQDLGSEVYVAKTNEFIKRKGLFKKKMKQVMVACIEDEDIKHIEQKAIREYETKNLEQFNKQINKALEERDYFKKQHEESKNIMNKALEERDYFKNQHENSKNEQGENALKAQLQDLKNTMRGMSLKMDSLDTTKLYSLAVQKLQKTLKDKDVDVDTISSIIRHITMNLTSAEQNDERLVNETARNFIANMVSNVRSITEDTQRKRKVVMFIGTTGVGKTTSIAKLATALNVSKKKTSKNPVGVISIDTFREGAIEQIANLCNYTDIPLKVANSKDTLLESIDSFADQEYLFIDTTGRSHNNVSEIRKVQAIVGDAIGKVDEVYLVMSATTKTQDMKDIYANFKCLNVNRVVFTKLDETDRYGNILSFINENPNIALSYITDGQVVPGDIELLNPTKFSESIISENNANSNFRL